MEQEKLTKMKGGKLKMASEKVEKALQMLKEEGVDTNIVTDETKGEVGSDEDEAEDADADGIVIEKAGFGRGFALYRDYSKDSRFTRLSR